MNTIRSIARAISLIPFGIAVLWLVFRETAKENHAELIRGSVLAPDNHPSKDRS